MTTIDKFLAEMDKKFGPNALNELGEGMAEVETVPTGLTTLDLATGVGGLPRGRIVEVYGPEGAGKTSVVLKAMAEAQKLAGQMPRLTYKPEDMSLIKPISGRVGFIDVEHAFDPSLARVHKVQMGPGSGFHFAQPDSGEDALQMAEIMVNSGLFDIIAIDSVAGLATQTELDGDIGDQAMAATARLMSQALKTLTGAIRKSRTVVIFINQIREKPAVKFGSPETTPGGRALKFYSSMRMRVSKGESIMQGALQVGHKMGIKVVKNKVAPPYSKTDIDLYYRDTNKGKLTGFDTFVDMLDAAQEMGIVELGGSQYRFVDRETGEIHKVTGLVKWQEYLAGQPNIVAQIEEAMFRKLVGYE